MPHESAENTGLSAAVGRVVGLSRRLWSVALSTEITGWPPKLPDENLLEESMRHPFTDAVKAGVVRPTEAGGFELAPDAFHPILLASKLFPNAAKSDVRAFVWRAIREYYECLPSPDTTHLFFLLSTSLNGFSEGTINRQETSIAGLHERLLWKLGPVSAVLENPQRQIDLFLECCRAVGYFEPGTTTGSVRFACSQSDPDFLLSNLFGLPTEIPGFDALFGGGGIGLPETLHPGGPNCSAPLGRVVLIKGRFGTGKSLLSLQLALAVARKGGQVRLIPLEQSPDAYRHMIESFGSVDKSAVNICTSSLSAGEITKGGERGDLIILGSHSAKSNYSNLLEFISEHTQKENSAYPLRLLIIDPINSVVGLDAEDIAKLRASLIEKINESKSNGVHILMIAEESDDADQKRNPAHFISNIADTVIRLSVDRRHQYLQRFIEIEKSRLQREQRGEHPFQIRSGSGIRVLISSAAIAATNQRSGRESVGGPERFGVSQFDDILGEGAFCHGDALVLQGPGGTYKTHLGVLFLLGSNKPDDRSGERSSLLLTARDDQASLKHVLEQPFVKLHEETLRRAGAQPNRIEISEARTSFIQPGAVFEILENQFAKAAAEGRRIERVMIDNISHWEMVCPFMREDESFGDALVTLLRNLGVTSLLICNDPIAHRGSVVQQSIVDNADVLVQTRRIPFRGTDRVALDVLKSRRMKHRPESFDVEIGRKGLELGSTGSAMLRVNPSGMVEPVPCLLYLHHESSIQREYNLQVLDSFRPVLSRRAKLNSKDRTHLVRAMRLNRFSTVDELQILQLDEFQAPELILGQDGKSALHTFKQASGDVDKAFFYSQAEMLHGLHGAADGDDNARAVFPYYQNVGLMAYRDKVPGVNAQIVKSWEALAEACKKWESRPDRKKLDLFFAFPSRTDENYNTLFFEIALAMGMPPPTDQGECRLQKWLKADRLNDALVVLNRLCKRCHEKDTAKRIKEESRRLEQERSGRRRSSGRSRDESVEAADITDDSAIVWRHWYTTLRAMIAPMDKTQAREIRVCLLPGKMAVAGEWYLAIPSYSAAPYVGLEVIKNLTDTGAEMDRLRRGVGLPMHKRFYEEGSGAPDSDDDWFMLSRDQLRERMEKPFRRSHLGCYSRITRTLAQHLKRIIELPNDEDDGRLKDNIRAITDHLANAISLLQGSAGCRTCVMNDHIPSDET